MKQVTIFFFLLLVITAKFSFSQLLPPGSWKADIAALPANRIIANNETLWFSTPYGIFSLQKTDKVFEVFNKTNGLSEALPSAIAALPNGKLIVGYSNGNIDMVNEWVVTNIPGLKNYPSPSEKKINSIYINNETAFLATDIGVVAVDLSTNSIKSTAFTGANGSTEKVYAITSFKDSIAAITESGLKMISVHDNFPDYNHWQLTASGNFKFLANDENTLILAGENEVYTYNGITAEPAYLTPYKINSISVYQNKLILTEYHALQSRITQLSTTTYSANYIQNEYIKHPLDAFMGQEGIWVADSVTGISLHTPTASFFYNPSAPANTLSGNILYQNNLLAGTAEKQNIASGNLIFFDNHNWHNYNAHEYPVLNNFPLLNSLDIHRLTGNIWVGSNGGGLLEIMPEGPADRNSLLASPNFSKKVTGLKFDSNHQLWVTDAGNPYQLFVINKEGMVHSFQVPFTIPSGLSLKLYIDKSNNKWLTVPDNGVIVFSDNNTPANTSDDRWRWLSVSNGNLPDNNVLSITEDANGLIWIGTANGIGIINCGQNLFANNCHAVQPVVRYDNFAGYLFQNQKVQAIAVNTANEKWVGTENGAWLISEDAEQLLQHFTSENSPLLHNNIQGIAINHSTGEVYFATERGLCLYKANATEGSLQKSDVLAYPNPVPPEYTGSIYIKGLPENAYFRITEPDGRLVYAGRASGGQAVWNGLNAAGRKISSGVYLVLVSTSDKKYNLATKIIYISK